MLRPAANSEELSQVQQRLASWPFRQPFPLTHRSTNLAGDCLTSLTKGPVGTHDLQHPAKTAFIGRPWLE